jgi:hypothetical protein
MTTFAQDLDKLIRKHLGKPRWGEDFIEIAAALHEAADRIDERSDRYPWRIDQPEPLPEGPPLRLKAADLRSFFLRREP